MSSVLPSFRKPPVHEVVMGVQFAPPPKITVAHFGLFWASVRQDYPEATENPPILPQIEDLASEAGIVPAQPDFTPRIFLLRDGTPWILQLQKDRFLHNWRLTSPSEPYPRYPVVSDRFFQQWGKFTKFAEENNLGLLEPRQLEITYLNQIVPWTNESRLSEVFPDLGWRTGNRIVLEPTVSSFAWSVNASDRCSRLRASAKTAINTQGERLLHLELTVRGIQGKRNLRQWFDEGRAWIVTAFADITGPEWHKRWEREK